MREKIQCSGGKYERIHVKLISSMRDKKERGRRVKFGNAYTNQADLAANIEQVQPH